MTTDRTPLVPPLEPPRRRLTLIAMCVGQGMILLDTTIVNVALPAIQRGLRVTPGSLEWTVNAYVLALASLILLGGTLGDRYGRKRLYLIGLVGFTVFSAACGLAGRDATLIVCRGLQGASAALMAPLTLSILVDAYPAEERTTAIGIWASVAGIGFGAGPIVGGLLIGRFGWPAVFWVNVPIGIAGFALALAAVRESRDPHSRSLDLARHRARLRRTLSPDVRGDRDERAPLALAVHALPRRARPRGARRLPRPRGADHESDGAARPVQEPRLQRRQRRCTCSPTPRSPGCSSSSRSTFRT